jgi:hypothetical protein
LGVVVLVVVLVGGVVHLSVVLVQEAEHVQVQDVQLVVLYVLPHVVVHELLVLQQYW